jgi:hypothetical protein
MTSKCIRISALSISLLVSGPANSRDNIHWEQLTPYVKVINEGLYTTRNGTQIKFVAVQFHLGYVKLRLLDTKQVVDSNRRVEGGVSRSFVNGREVAEILNYGLEGVLQRQGKKIVVLAPAGWSRSQRYLEHVGLLRINGREIHKISNRAGMSAILCLNDTHEYPNYDAFVPVVFFANDASNLNRRALLCSDAVQVGPRVIEENARPGITESERGSTKYQRVLFAVDEPDRGKNLPRKSRDAARNGYIVVTKNPVHLFDVQEMLLDPRFYDGHKPHWAVNMAGANLTGLVLISNKGTEFIENTQAVVGSVLAIDRRD